MQTIVTTINARVDRWSIGSSSSKPTARPRSNGSRMTRDQVMAKAAAALDVAIADARQQFEASLIADAAPRDQLDPVLDWSEDYWATWRAETQTQILADPLDADFVRRAEPVRELRRVMLNVADVDELMFQLRHVVETSRSVWVGLNLSPASTFFNEPPPRPACPWSRSPWMRESAFSRPS